MGGRRLPCPVPAESPWAGLRSAASAWANHPRRLPLLLFSFYKEIIHILKSTTTTQDLTVLSVTGNPPFILFQFRRASHSSRSRKSPLSLCRARASAISTYKCAINHYGFTLPALPSGKEIRFFFPVSQQEDLNVYTCACTPLPLPLLICSRSPKNCRVFHPKTWKHPGGDGCQSDTFTIPFGKKGPNREQRMAATRTMTNLSVMLPRGAVAPLTLAYSCDYIKEKASKGASLFHSSAVTLPLVIEHIKGTLPHVLRLPFFKHLPVFFLLLDEHVPLLRELAV